jgi:hypothetical protein
MYKIPSGKYILIGIPKAICVAIFLLEARWLARAVLEPKVRVRIPVGVGFYKIHPSFPHSVTIAGI